MTEKGEEMMEVGWVAIYKKDKKVAWCPSPLAALFRSVGAF